MRHIAILLPPITFLLASCVTTPEYVPYADLRLNHYIEHRPDNRKWESAFFNRTTDRMISEWKLTSQSDGNIDELVAYEAFIRPTQYTAQQHADWLINQIAPNSIDFKAEFVKDTPDDVILEWSHKGLKKAPAMHQFIRIFRGSDGVYSLAYTVKKSVFNEAYYELWSNNISDAALRSAIPGKGNPEFEEQMELIKTIEQHRTYGLHIIPCIPLKKLKNARKSCIVPANETIFALIDSTSFGSAKSCLIIGSSGVFFHNGWGGKSPGRHFIPYSEFADQPIDKNGWYEVAIGSHNFNTAASSMSKNKIINLLQDVQTHISSSSKQSAEGPQNEAKP